MAISVLIDKLTSSIERVSTGEVIKTSIVEMDRIWLRSLKKAQWKFDWLLEFNAEGRQVYGLMTALDARTIHGLISLEVKADHVFAHAIESHRMNKGRRKEYSGVPGNLVAWACKIAFDEGHDGVVAFVPKSALRDHYAETLGAVVHSGSRMHIPTHKALELVEQYARSWQK